MKDYPAAITAVNPVEPVPRRIRAFLAGEKVLDTTGALYVWEWPYYPQYYIPVADVRRDLLIPEGHTQQSRRGTSEAHTLRAGTVQRPGAARLLTDSPVPGRTAFSPATTRRCSFITTPPTTSGQPARRRRSDSSRQRSIQLTSGRLSSPPGAERAIPDISGPSPRAFVCFSTSTT